MKSLTKQSHWLLTLLSSIILLAGITACSSNEGGDGNNPLPDIPVSEGDWQTVPSTGGTIEKDSISITFPSGTFSKDSKVAITAVNKGLIGSDYEASPFYKIVMPATTGRTITIRMKSNEIGDDIHFVMRERGAAMSYGDAVLIDSYLDASYSNGEYVATLPPIENGSEIDVNMELIMGVSHIPQDAPSTRGTTAMTSGEVGDIKWEITYPLATIINLGIFKSSTHAKVESFKPVLNQCVKEAITKITDLGFKTNGKRKIPIYIESLSDRWGQHNQSTTSDANSSISISYEEMAKAVPDTAGLRNTIIHELFHYFQAEYDPRPALIKGRSSLSPLAAAGALWEKLDPEELIGDEVVMYEMGAVWIEHLMNNGQLNASFQKNEAQGEESISNDRVGFIDILSNYPDKSTKKEKYQTHGYAMAPLLYYITAKLDPYKTYGIDNSFVLELHQLWKSKFTTFKFSSTTYDCLTSLVGAKNCSFFYSNEEFEDYVLQLLSGKLIDGFRIQKTSMVKDPKTLKQDEGSFTFDGVIAPFGFSARVVTLQGLEGKDLSQKKIVIKQETEGMKTFLLMTGKDSDFAKFTVEKNTATTAGSIVIDGSRLEKMRQENGKFLNDFYLVTIRTDCTPSSRDTKNYTATFELKGEEDDGRARVHPDEVRIGAAGSTELVTIEKGNYKYCGVDPVPSAYDSWLSVMFNADGNEVAIVALPNNTNEEREGTIYCWVSNKEYPSDAEKKLLPVTVFQEAGNAEETLLDVTDLFFPVEGGVKTIKYSFGEYQWMGRDWDDDTWLRTSWSKDYLSVISYNPSSDNRFANELYVSAFPNESGVERKQQIRFGYTNEKGQDFNKRKIYSVNVLQEGGSFSLDKMKNLFVGTWYTPQDIIYKNGDYYHRRRTFRADNTYVFEGQTTSSTSKPSSWVEEETGTYTIRDYSVSDHVKIHIEIPIPGGYLLGLIEVWPHFMYFAYENTDGSLVHGVYMERE